jgi:hypothetical protein
MKILCVVAMLALLTMNTGCLSVWSESCSRDELTLKKAVLSNNEQAIRAVRLGDNGVGFGIDIGNLEALKYHPVRQIFAAVGDAALLYGAYEGVKSITDNSSHNGDESSDSSSAGRDNNDITVNGDGNTVNVGNDTKSEPKAE